MLRFLRLSRRTMFWIFIILICIAILIAVFNIQILPIRDISSLKSN